MTDEEHAAELDLTERVGREFVRLGLREHVARTRAYYRDVRAGRASKEWSHEQSVEWLRVLRLPPHENDYPVRRRMAGCPGCATSRPLTLLVFPGGSKHQCGGCRTVWLELDGMG